MTVIAMPREMGTLGKDVAAGVAERLGLEVVHHELVERDLADRLQVGQGAVHKFLEGTPSLLDRWNIDSNKLYQYTAEEMLQLAEQGNIVIRGWGAVSLLRRIPHVLCVRVCAPMEFRIKEMMKRLNVKARGIANLVIEENEKAHLRSAQSRNVLDWTNSTNFDLVLNVERLPISDCVEQVCQLAGSEAFAITDQSRSVLSDMLVETRLKNELGRKENGNIISYGVEVHVRDGEVVLTGTVSDDSIAKRANQVAEGISGTKVVENNIMVISSAQYQM